MKGWMKKAGAVCLTAALSACMMTACDPISAWGYELELVSKPTITEQAFDEETGLHTILVEGLAQNNTGICLTEASVTIWLYDELGDPIDDTGYAYIDGMDVGEVWHYYALIELETVPVKAEVVAYGDDY